MDKKQTSIFKQELSKVDQLLKNKSYAEAAKALDNLEKQNPTHPGLLLRKANYFFDVKNYVACIETAKKYSIPLENYNFCHLIAKSYFQQGKLVESKKTYEFLTKIKPTKPASLLGLANIHYLLNDFAKAESIHLDLLKENSDSLIVYLHQLRLLKTTSRLSELIDLSSLVVDKWPNSLKGLKYLIEGLIKDNQYDKAIKLLDEKKSVFNNNLEFLKLFSTCLIEASRLEEAKEFLLKIHQQDSISLVPVYGFARISRLEKKHSQKNIWTGERFVPDIGMEATIMADHFNRYHLASKLAKGKKVLDIACGEGYGSHLLAQSSLHVTGVDIHQDTIEQAKIKYTLPNLVYKQGSCLDIPLENNSVEVVVSFETIEHILEHEEMIKELKRVLTPDGLLILSSPEKQEYSEANDYDNEFHLKEMNLSELEALLNSNFKRNKVYGQKRFYGSIISQIKESQPFSIDFISESTCLNEKKLEPNKHRFKISDSMPQPTYYIAIASDSSLPVNINASLLEIEENDNPMVHYLKNGYLALQQALSQQSDSNPSFIKNYIPTQADRSLLDDSKKSIKNGDKKAAIQLLETGVENQPAFMPYHVNLIIAYIKNGQYIKANDSIEKATFLFPNEVSFKISKANVLILTGDHESAHSLLKSMEAQGIDRTEVKELLQKTSKHLGKSMYEQDGLKTQNNHDFISEDKFVAAYNRGLKATDNRDYLWHWRIHIGLWVAENASKLPGDFVECGVNRGFLSSAIMHDLGWDKLGKKFYLVDTYKGIDESLITENERKRGIIEKNKKLLSNGFYTDNIDEVKRNFSEWKNAVIVEGSIPEVLDNITTESVSYLHIDLNCAKPEIESIEYFWDKIVKGGFVLLDDYGGVGFEEQKQAMDEIAIKYDFPIASLPTGQGLIIKQ